MRFSPRAPQIPIIDFGLSHERGNIFASMGTGKSSAGFYIYDALRMFGEAKRCLVIGPRRVALSTWPDERTKFFESFGHLKVAAAIGTPDQRRAAVMSKPDILTINYEQLEWLVAGYGDDWPFDMVLADESTRLKGLRIALIRQANGGTHLRGQGSVRAKAVAKVAHKKVRRWLNLTGSPAPNGLQDLWAQMWFVDGGTKLGTSFTGFKDRWFRSVPGTDGYSQIEPLKHADGEIKALIRDSCVTVDFADYFPIDKPIEHVLKIKLPPAARAIYDKMEKELFAELRNGVEIQAFNAGSKCQKCLQLGNGTVYDDERNWHKVHDAKLEALESIVAEANGESILVRYTHIPDRERILKAFPRAKMLAANWTAQKADWIAGRIPLLLTHAASAGHGVDGIQDGGRILVDYCTDYNLEHDEQIIERLGPTRQFQSGHPRPVYRHRLVAEDTIEEHSALPRIRSKASVQDSLKAAMKLRS
jgi:SNF2 family DNA or RNA helicase